MKESIAVQPEAGQTDAMPRRIPGTPASEQITVRVDPALIQRADALIDSLTERNGLPAARADVYRLALIKGMRDLELELAANGMRAAPAPTKKKR
jgi:hypothetical protein